MHAVLHVLATLLLLPYVLLAIAFLLLEQAIGDGTLSTLLATLLSQALWLIPWGVLGFLIFAIALAALGMHPASRRLGGFLLCLVAVVCIVLIIVKPAEPVGLDALLFLSPCILVAAYGAWMAFAEGPVARHPGRQSDVHDVGT